MKRKIIPLIQTYILLMSCYLVLSVILAIICTFIHLSSFAYEIIVYVLSYIILLIATIFLFKIVKRSYLLYGSVFAGSYLLIMIIFHIDHFSLSIILKPAIILAVFCGLYYLKKNNDV